MTNNNEMIDHAIGLLMMQNEEDAAQAIDNLRRELERVKGIAWRRLDRIAQLQHDKLILGDKLKDARARLDDLEVEASLTRIRELDELGREPRSHIDYELEDHGGLWGAHCRGEI